VKDCTNCNLNFESNKKNQKYCSPACCRLATNKKIMAKYYENKKRLNGEKRYCRCGQLLSRYNENNLCSPCIINNKKQNNENILEVINHVIKKINKAKR
jgi:hypothetical protein